MEGFHSMHEEVDLDGAGSLPSFQSVVPLHAHEEVPSCRVLDWNSMSVVHIRMCALVLFG